MCMYLHNIHTHIRIRTHVYIFARPLFLDPLSRALNTRARALRRVAVAAAAAQGYTRVCVCVYTSVSLTARPPSLSPAHIVVVALALHARNRWNCCRHRCCCWWMLPPWRAREIRRNDTVARGEEGGGGYIEGVYISRGRRGDFSLARSFYTRLIERHPPHAAAAARAV